MRATHDQETTSMVSIKQAWLNWMTAQPYRCWVAMVFFFQYQKPYELHDIMVIRQVRQGESYGLVIQWKQGWATVLQMQVVCREFRVAVRNMVCEMVLLEHQQAYEAFWRGTLASWHRWKAP